MRLSKKLKVRVRYHLGYPNVAPGPSLPLGIPSGHALLFLLERAMSLLLPEAKSVVRAIVNQLDYIDEVLIGAKQLRPKKIAALRREYLFRVARLADALQCPVYPFSHRYKKRASVTQPRRKRRRSLAALSARQTAASSVAKRRKRG